MLILSLVISYQLLVYKRESLKLYFVVVSLHYVKKYNFILDLQANFYN